MDRVCCWIAASVIQGIQYIIPKIERSHVVAPVLGLVLSGLLFGSLPANAASDVETAAMPPDIQRIIDRGSLIVALLDTDNPPFFMAGEGDRLDGLDVKLATDLAHGLGVRLEFNRSATTFNEVVDTVFNHHADIAISKISRTMSRIQRVRFSDPYLRMRQGLLVNRLRLAQQTNGRSVPETIRALQGQVGVIEGSSYVGFLNQKFPDATVVEYPTWDDTVDAVARGEVLAAYRDELEIKKVVRSSPNAALQMETIALTDTEDPIAMVLPWNSTHLLAMVNQYLDTERLEHSAETVLQDYADYFDVN
ncbi:MAG: ABC transporter substrate-binding protein [Cyanobacteria bacterium P01_E01_bin.6]